jgi:hypothetical protein
LKIVIMAAVSVSLGVARSPGRDFWCLVSRYRSDINLSRRREYGV